MRLALAVGVAAVMVSGGVARALPAGTLVITTSQMDPKSPTFEKDLKKAQKTELVKDGEAGWHLYFVAYLKKAAGAQEVNIVLYDVSGGKREQINAFPVTTQPTAKIIMSDVQLSTEQGFKVGAKYDVMITRLSGGHEDVYARARLELK